MWSRFKKKIGVSAKTDAAATATPAAQPQALQIPPETATSAPAPLSTAVPYRPELVDKLKADHQELFRIYHRMADAAQQHKTDGIAADLAAFRRAFQSHILVENVSFYVYLERILAHSPEELGYVRALRKDMNGIAKAVSDFIHAWTTQPPTAHTAGRFAEQLSGIGKALVARVELEESSLYVLYVAA